MNIRAGETSMQRFTQLTLVGLASAVGALPAMPGAAQSEKVLHSFLNHPGDGSSPIGQMLTNKGVLYGTTNTGGEHQKGVVFRLEKVKGVWNETILYSFADKGDGAYPAAGLIMDSAGVLYGTTASGGIAEGGVAFSLTRSGNGWVEEVLHNFTGGVADGAHPAADLRRDQTSGILYGTTYEGGTSNCGVVYQLALSGGMWTETVLYNLGASAGCNSQAALKEDSSGNLYGVTSSGGQYGYGTAYMLTPSNGAWSETVLHDFAGGTDGANGSAIDISPAGILFGTTNAGGSAGAGVVFELINSGGSWSETVLHDFAGTPDGATPCGMHFDSSTGALYGTTQGGGTSNRGSVFQLVPTGNTWSESVIHSFTGTPDGDRPEAGLALDEKTGALYGTTAEGGTANAGVVFSVVP
jgi:uncharacterized repeat protein (TIGR03803 family)